MGFKTAWTYHSRILAACHAWFYSPSWTGRIVSGPCAGPDTDPVWRREGLSEK